MRSAVRSEGIAGFVPSDDEQVTDARAWAAFAGLGSGDETLAAAVARVRSEERSELGWALEDAQGVPVSEDLIDLRHATLLGLRTKMCSLVEPMTPVAARAVWASLDAASAPRHSLTGW